jgi:Trk-type K+ transport system membrane component
MSGTSLFPVLLRNFVIMLRLLAPWRHKVIFDYILMNNHRLSTLLFPTLQTRIYLLITVLLYVMGVSISLILDLTNDTFAIYRPGTRVLIFFFQTVNSRFAGFQTVDLTLFATATLVVYLMLMATKPQMLCALDESPFELSWLALQAREKADAQTNPVERLSSTPIINHDTSTASTSADAVLFMQHAERFLHRQSLVTKDLARQHFSRNFRIGENRQDEPNHLTALHIRLFLIYFIRALLKNAFSFFILTRTWLFVFIFLICAFEYRQMAPVDPNITIWHIIFEIVSAFGTVGFTLGYPDVTSSFATVLSPASKVILIITMFLGRHRGLLASMKDQEAIEHSAADLIRRRREEVILQFERSKVDTDQGNEPMADTKIHWF